MKKSINNKDSTVSCQLNTNIIMWNWLGITNEPKTGEAVAEEVITDSESGKTDPGEIVFAEGEKENATQEKVKDVATNIGNYIYSFASIATEKAAKLKGTVDETLEKTIVGDFNRENEKFVQERDARRICDAVPPWVGYHEEELMKSQILALSSDERNVLREPPSGVDFQFNLTHAMPIALAVLKEDPDLDALRFKLVPKRINEEKFWRNYFYRVSLIKQSTQLSTISGKESKNSPRMSHSDAVNKNAGKTESKEKLHEEVHEDHSLEDTSSPTTNEFASDAFDEDAHLSEEEKTQILLGANEGTTDTNDTEKAESAENDWELDKEIQDELESFELVDNGDGDDKSDEWQKEIEDLLGEEEIVH